MGETPERVSIGRSGPVGGRVRVPGSKSVTNRALVVASLAAGTSRISGGLAGDDAYSMVEGLRRLGASITELGRLVPAWEVTGIGGSSGDAHQRAVAGPGSSVTIDAHLAGTTLRFLTAAASLGNGGITVTGSEALLSRPIGDLLEALLACGADVAGSGSDGDRAPVQVGRRRRPLGGRVAVDAARSSQFVTALLLVAPCFDEDLELDVRGLGSEGFVALTLEVMAHFGAAAERRTVGRYHVRAGTGYRAADYAVPPDASAAGHLATLALATGGSVTIERLSSARSQPDHRFLEVARLAGADVTEQPAAGGDVTISAPARLDPIDVDLQEMPDQLPNAAVLAALAPGTSRLARVGITRFHETDRMAAVRDELAKAGVAVELEGEDVVVHGGSASGGATFSSHGDHRMAMALAALAAALGDCAIEGAGAVSKTYRDFWHDAERLGLRLVTPT